MSPLALILTAASFIIIAACFCAVVDYALCQTAAKPRPNLPASRAERDASTVYPDVALFAADVRRDIRALPDLWDVAP